MSRGREARHTAMVLACVALMAVSAGCRRSPFQRLADGTAPESSPAAAQPEIPRLLPVPEKGSGTVVAPVPEKGSETESMSGPAAPVPTPLLDAALEHAEAVEQAHREATAARELPSSTEVASQPDVPGKVLAAGPRKSAKDDKEPVRTVKLSSSGQAQVSTPSDAGLKSRSEPPRATAPLADPASRSGSGDVATVPPVRAQVVDWLAVEAAKPANQALFQRAVNTIADAVKNSAKDDSTRSADIRSAVLALEDRAPLCVSEPRLCRMVSGFGSFEPLPASGLRAGQPFLIYCELAGLRYQARDTSYVSRLSSRVELISARDGTKVWEQSLGEAEDQCRSRRRDNYVNYRITLPQTLPAGDYRLRLTQTDLVANHSASSELSLTVTR
ncbi:MAG: hypothetical protein ACLQU5_16305 [Isosphaeraceae bacterium]